MTVEQKRELLEEHCTCTMCKECPLSWEQGSEWCGTHTITYSSEEELDEGLKLIGKLPTETLETPELTEPPKEDVVNHPSHYTNGGMECIDEMILIFGEAAVMNFCLCNAWKYRKRALFKGKPEEDMAKSDAYIRCYKSLKEEGIAKFKS